MVSDAHNDADEANQESNQSEALTQEQPLLQPSPSDGGTELESNRAGEEDPNLPESSPVNA